MAELLSADQVAAIRMAAETVIEYPAPRSSAATVDQVLALCQQDARWRHWVEYSLLPAWRSLDSEPMNGPMHTAMQALAVLLDGEPPDAG